MSKYNLLYFLLFFEVIKAYHLIKQKLKHCIERCFNIYRYNIYIKTNKIEWNKFFTNCIFDEDLDFTVYKEHLQLNHKKTNDPNKKWQKIWIDIPPQKICNSSLSIFNIVREIQIKNTIKCHFIFTRMVIYLKNGH